MKTTLANGLDIFKEKKYLIAGILNVTPDSFSDGGIFFDKKPAVERALLMEREGADIIDIGGESTRPGAEPVTIEEELERIIPVIGEIRKRSNIIISVDTYKSKVAEEAIKSGADIVNDVSGTSFDSKMVDIVKKYNVPIIIMHIKGTPKNMQKNPVYNNLLEEIYEFLREKKEKLNRAGIGDDKIIVDPGIGFGKTWDDNFKIINNLAYFKELNLPILIGVSKKSFLSLGGKYSVGEREEQTCVANLISLMKGASIVRVHNVVSARKMIETLLAFEEN